MALCINKSVFSLGCDTTLLVHGTSNVDKEALELFFESPRKCGGDDIRSLEINDDGTALIVYEEIGGKWSLVFIMLYE